MSGLAERLSGCQEGFCFMKLDEIHYGKLFTELQEFKRTRNLIKLL
jgi:hypothetical protein